MSSLEGPLEFKKPHSELTDSEREKYNQKANQLILEKFKELMFWNRSDKKCSPERFLCLKRRILLGVFLETDELNVTQNESDYDAEGYYQKPELGIFGHHSPDDAVHRGKNPAEKKTVGNHFDFVDER